MENMYKIKRDITIRLNNIYIKYNKLIEEYKYDTKNPYYMAIDVETTGIPIMENSSKYYDPSKVSKYDLSRIVQIGYIVFTRNGDYLSGKKYIIKPDNFIITESKYHNITQNIAMTKGVNFLYFLKNLQKDIKNVKGIIGHNILFDINVLTSEMYRAKNTALPKHIAGIKKHCTMELSKNICGLVINTIYGQKNKISIIT